MVYLSESLGRLGQNRGTLGAHLSLGAPPYAAPRRTAPDCYWIGNHMESNASVCAALK